MKKITFRLSAVILSLFAMVQVVATESIDETKIAEKDGRVLISNTRGHIEVFGWDRAEIRVRGDLDDRTEEFIFEVDGHSAEIRVRIPQHTHFGDGSNLEIHVPSGSRVRFKGISSDIDMTDVSGGVEVNTVSGDIRLEKIDSRVHVNTVSGDVDLKDGKGVVKMVAVSGSLNLSYDAGELSLQTVSGDIDGRLKSFDNLVAEVVSGDVEIRGSLSSEGSLEAESVSGDIELKFLDDIDARISIRTGPGGDIHNDLTNVKPEVVFPGQMKLETTVGNGDGRIRVNTVTGDVRIDKG